MANGDVNFTPITPCENVDDTVACLVRAWARVFRVTDILLPEVAMKRALPSLFYIEQRKQIDAMFQKIGVDNVTIS